MDKEDDQQPGTSGRMIELINAGAAVQNLRSKSASSGGLLVIIV